MAVFRQDPRFWLDNLLALNRQAASTMEQLKASAAASFASLAGYSDTLTINGSSFTRTVTVTPLSAPDGSGATSDYVQITVQVGNVSATTFGHPAMMRLPMPNTRLPRACLFTLVELLTATAVISIVSTAVATMLFGAMNTSRYVIGSGDSVWQIEDASRRISFILRMSSSLDAPATTTPTHSFTIHTQADSSNGNTTYQDSYALSGTNLSETDSRYGTNTILQNVSSFTVTRLSTSSPTSVQIDITAGSQKSLTRSFIVLCRNL